MIGNSTESDTRAGGAKRRFFSGDSLQQALVQAANHFHIDPEEIAYQVLDKRHGFLKTRRKVMIEVDPDAPRRISSAPKSNLAAISPAPVAVSVAPVPSVEPAKATEISPVQLRAAEEPRPFSPGRQVEPPPERKADLVALPERPRGAAERYPLATGSAAEAAATSISLLLRIAGLNLSSRVLQGDDRLEIDLAGEDIDWCFADDGELILSFEHLLPRMVRTISGESLLCRVDCDNFHEIREERLRSLAQRTADDVRSKGRSRTLVPMNPADRRIIHMTLADDSAVVTESEGEGYFKRVTVRPAGN